MEIMQQWKSVHTDEIIHQVGLPSTEHINYFDVIIFDEQVLFDRCAHIYFGLYLDVVV